MGLALAGRLRRIMSAKEYEKANHKHKEKKEAYSASSKTA